MNLFAGLKRIKSVTALNVNKVQFDSEQLESLSEVKSIMLFLFLHLNVLTSA